VRALSRLLLLLACLWPAAGGASAFGEPPALAEPSPSPAPQEHRAADGAGPWAQAVAWIDRTQRGLHRRLAEAVEAFHAAPDGARVGGLTLLSLLYGIFHAAGPGHGKAVITTYLLSQPGRVRRGLALAALASLLQGVSALLLVLVVMGIGGGLAREALGPVPQLERVSYALIAALGAWLTLRGALGIWRPRRTWPAGGAIAGAGGHGHCCAAGAFPAAAGGGLLAPALAVGVRPCTGAVLVLAVATLLGEWLAGVLAVLAMAVGTGVTVGLLGLLAVQARGLALRLAGGGARMHRAATLLGLLGGLLLLALGLSLLQGSLAGSGRYTLIG